MGRILALLALVSGCRFGFDESEPAAIPLACQAQGVTLGITPAGMTATATPEGLAVFVVDGSGIVRGSSYAIDEQGITPMLENATIGGGDANGTIGVAAAGSTAMLAVSLGKPTATGTALFALATDDLTELAAPSVRDGELAATHPVASDGSTFAYATQLATKETNVRFVAPDANDASAPIMVGDAAVKPSNVAIAYFDTGYVMTFGASMTGVTAWTNIARLDHALAPVGDPIHIDSDPSYDAYRPVVSYARSSHRYLVAYHAKDVTDDDDVWIELFDESFAPLGPAQKIAVYSQEPALSTDGTDFWITYRIYDPASLVPDAIGVQYVTAQGFASPFTLADAAGKLGKYATFERAGQAVVVWSQSGAGATDMFIAPLCR